MVDIYLFSISILGRNELIVKVLVGTFNQEKAQVFRYCEIFANLRFQLGSRAGNWRLAAAQCMV